MYLHERIKLQVSDCDNICDIHHHVQQLRPYTFIFNVVVVMLLR